jgi:hypothetical protein
MYNDHTPILAVLNSTQPRINKPFRFWKLVTSGTWFSGHCST